MPNKFHAKYRFINHNKPSNKTSNYGKSGNTTQYPHPQCVANQAQQRTNSWILTKMYHSNININNAASSKNESSEQKIYSRTTPGLSKFPTTIINHLWIKWAIPYVSSVGKSALQGTAQNTHTSLGNMP